MNDDNHDSTAKHLMLIDGLADELKVPMDSIDFSRDFANTGWQFDSREELNGWEKMSDKLDIPSLEELLELSPEKKLPEPKHHCYCTTHIHVNALIQHLQTKRLFFVGRICVWKCGLLKHTCYDCYAKTRCFTRRCHKCRVKCNLHDKYHDDNRYCGDKPPKRTCIDCGKANRAHTDRCGECRVKCNLHDEYHGDNRYCGDKPPKRTCIDCGKANRTRTDRCKSCRTRYQENAALERKTKLAEKKRTDRKNEMMSRPIRFGKYKGTLYRDIEPQYLKWLSKAVDGHEWLAK